MGKENDKRVRITVTLNRDAYEKIKDISHQMGLLPATWVAMMATARANNIDIGSASENGNGN